MSPRPLNLVQKILAEHGAAGGLEAGEEATIAVDQGLLQDATGVPAALQLEAMGIDRIATRLGVVYIDHNLLQTGVESQIDHRYLESVAARFGLHYSRPGNGICHQVHLERFAAPGEVLVGSDSHSPMAGGLGMLAIGVGSLDAAVALGTGRYRLTVPKVIRVTLTGRLAPWVSAKDVVLEVARRLTVKGGVGAVVEYGGPGVATLSAPERATITNMAVEMGATSAIFPSDDRTREFLEAQGRGAVFRPLAADPGAAYDREIEIDLSALPPLVALPPSPDNVVPVDQAEGTPVGQVIIGSCTNSSYRDLMAVAAVLRGRRVAPGVDLVLAPGSRQVLTMIARNGALADFVEAGARLIESGCGPCPGMGQVPAPGTASLRTFNRNFPGRCGSKEVDVYLSSPEVAAASALDGAIRDPRRLGAAPSVAVPVAFAVDDSLVVAPPSDGRDRPITRGETIKPVPVARPLGEALEGEVLLKVGDDVNTDQIAPSGARFLPMRSNVPALAEFTFAPLDPGFAARAKAAGGGIVVGGRNYGQGSSREVAVLCPLHLGLRAVVAKSFARIHRANLVNFAIVPLVFADEDDYDRVSQGDRLAVPGLKAAIVRGDETVEATNLSSGRPVGLRLAFTPRERELLLAGGLLAAMRAGRA